jgi:FkbM family methyltransferase
MKSQKVRLPNGMEIHSQRAEEARLMYGEVGNYLKYGLTLKPGAVIVDVGANIGLFALWAYQHCQGNLSVYAFEPIPAIFEMLAANFKHIDGQRLRAFQLGLSSQAGQVSFAYYPNATFASTAYPDTPAADRQLTATLLARSLHQLPAPLSWSQHLPAVVQKPIVQLLARYINQRRFVTCELQTLSAVMQAHHIERIDFLKIDAEKSELDVLQGIAAADWGKIQQVFVEVHNREGRVSAICELLRGQGFRQVIQEQEPYFAGTDIHAVYASREAGTLPGGTGGA